jgi:hypothetical protein
VDRLAVSARPSSATTAAWPCSSSSARIGATRSGCSACAFDLLEVNGEDIRREPIEDRKRRLAGLLRLPHEGIAVHEHFGGDGAMVYKHACALACPGPPATRWPVAAGRAQSGEGTARRAPGGGVQALLTSRLYRCFIYQEQTAGCALLRRPRPQRASTRFRVCEDEPLG